MSLRLSITCLLVSLFLVSVRASAEPRVLHVGPHAIGLPAPIPRPVEDGQEHSGVPLTNEGGISILPMTPDTLTLGLFSHYQNPASEQIRQHLRPICVVGSDGSSLSWLRQKRDHLLSANAFCWVVQAKNAKDLGLVADVAKPITVVPVPGSLLTEKFGLTHYPALIGPNWVEQ